MSRDAILRTLSFHEAWGYAPTAAELLLTLDTGYGERGTVSGEQTNRAFEELLREGAVAERHGRFGCAGRIGDLAATVRERDLFQPRKRRRAVQVARWLARLGGVRFVALANTTALGSARDEGDLDFFVVVKAGTIWSSRLMGDGPFKLLGMSPKGEDARDAVCLSYFVTDDGLDLATHQLHGDDPYYRYWFLSLLPLFDDGISKELWDANAAVRARHPFARLWIAPPDLRVAFPAHRSPLTAHRFIDPAARSFQRRWFPPRIRERMNRDTTVIVNDRALKFHVTDNRRTFRERYEELCKERGVNP